MLEHVHTVLRWLAMIACILGACWLYKNQTRVTISRDDGSMDPDVFPEGGYGINTAPNRPEDLHTGDVVAYYVPTQPQQQRVARVAAIEGQRIEVSAGVVKVDGAPARFKADDPNWKFPEVRVPRGCVYLLADTRRLSLDSSQVGPVPFYCVIGKLKY